MLDFQGCTVNIPYYCMFWAPVGVVSMALVFRVEFISNSKNSFCTCFYSFFSCKKQVSHFHPNKHPGVGCKVFSLELWKFIFYGCYFSEPPFLHHHFREYVFWFFFRKSIFCSKSKVCFFSCWQLAGSRTFPGKSGLTGTELEIRFAQIAVGGPRVTECHWGKLSDWHAPSKNIGPIKLRGGTPPKNYFKNLVGEIWKRFSLVIFLGLNFAWGWCISWGKLYIWFLSMAI